ncbi:unnamed protein product [Danaus chrysippus]|uniref:(African queen) hypothetical protein n=1 Tax=Danaus chrysippus TaxID=151541 RepID=A0A8J2WCG2_9NEOP|nr:unnamed protein product [Danaus chrysippus]
MNSAVSTESMDMAEEEMSQVEGCERHERRGHQATSGRWPSRHGGSSSDRLIQETQETALIRDEPLRKEETSEQTAEELRQTIEEFATRVGQQAVVLVATPGKPNTSYRVFGAKPLEDVVRNLRCMIMEELENALAQQFGLGGCAQAPPPPQDDPSLFELPPLIIDGIPTPVEKMTQAQLRAFIPLMLKYSMVRGKPGWGRESTRPPWWPKDLPWANVRMDARSEDEKQKMSWTHALRQIVINCYKYHGRGPAFTENDKGMLLMSWTHALRQIVINCYKYHGRRCSALTFTEDDDDKQAPQTSSSCASGSTSRSQPAVLASQQVCIDQMTLADVDMSQYAPAMLQTITNPDGTVSLIQVDPNSPIITLPDGTTAQVIHSGSEGAASVVQALEGEGAVAVDLNAVAEATLNHDGQIILTGEDGHGYPVSVSGVITVPVSASVYQSMVASMQQQDGVCVTPLVQVEQGGETLEALSMGGGVAQVVLQGGEQVLQVLSLKDASVLTKAMVQIL